MNQSLEFQIGDKVRTTKGCRLQGTFSGVIVKFSTWSGIPAANVKKYNGRTVQCLTKNLVKE